LINNLKNILSHLNRIHTGGEPEFCEHLAAVPEKRTGPGVRQSMRNTRLWHWWEEKDCTALFRWPAGLHESWAARVLLCIWPDWLPAWPLSRASFGGKKPTN